MKIREIRCAGLRGATPEGGWSNELRPDDCVHTLIAVHTDEGAVGLGSVFTNDALVRASLAVLEPLYRGENALEPERVSEKASTSRCGICSARRQDSLSGDCSAVVIANACNRMPRCSWMSRRSCAIIFSK
jgi:L-alanine-DL-glutamate epimerase-like enolase superfamily enzyme